MLGEVFRELYLGFRDLVVGHYDFLSGRNHRIDNEEISARVESLSGMPHFDEFDESVRIPLTSSGQPRSYRPSALLRSTQRRHAHNVTDPIFSAVYRRECNEALSIVKAKYEAYVAAPQLNPQGA